jgi:hypothetical protein
MKCSFCRTEKSNLVKGPADYSICYDCIQKGFGEHCNFCNQIIGTKKGILKNQALLAARIENGVIMCNECLQTTSESIVVKQQKAA